MLTASTSIHRGQYVFFFFDWRPKICFQSFPFGIHLMLNHPENKETNKLLNPEKSKAQLFPI